MSNSAYYNTAFDAAYGAKARSGTMGILCRGTEVLIIRRRLKTNEISENGPPGKHMPRLTAVSHGTDTWAFPGGGLEPDETPEQCIVREIKEELGIDATIQYNGDEPAWGTTDDDVDGKLWRCTFFIVRQADPEQIIEVREPHKHVDFMWIKWEELWAKILAQNEGRGTANERGEEEMRFFPSLQNMVLKYPNRSSPACLIRPGTYAMLVDTLLLIVLSMVLSSLLNKRPRRLRGSN